MPHGWLLLPLFVAGPSPVEVGIQARQLQSMGSHGPSLLSRSAKHPMDGRHSVMSTYLYSHVFQLDHETSIDRIASHPATVASDFEASGGQVLALLAIDPFFPRLIVHRTMMRSSPLIPETPLPGGRRQSDQDGPHTSGPRKTKVRDARDKWDTSGTMVRSRSMAATPPKRQDLKRELSWPRRGSWNAQPLAVPDSLVNEVSRGESRRGSAEARVSRLSTSSQNCSVSAS